MSKQDESILKINNQNTNKGNQEQHGGGNTKRLKQDLIGDNMGVYMLYRNRENIVEYIANNNDQPPKSICNKVCEFFKNLFCCGCGCIKTRD